MMLQERKTIALKLAVYYLSQSLDETQSDQWRERTWKMCSKYLAEYEGLLRSEFSSSGTPTYSTDRDEQAAFERGLSDGRAILESQIKEEDHA